MQEILRENVPGLPFGMGRSYGDVCTSKDGILWNTTGLNRFISFDKDTGCLRCEAGVILKDILELFVPLGWTLPVVPGTQFVTVGGAVANDVHGKNHHRFGSFGEHVGKISLARSDGQIVECSRDQNSDLFYATLGGVGLTGVICYADLQLRRIPGAWLETESIPFFNIEDFMRLDVQSSDGWESTVAWIDCLSKGDLKGIYFRGNPVPCDHAPPTIRRASVRISPPISLINKVSLKAFNTAYFGAQRWKAGRSLKHYVPFFFPLDHILNWNRIYGPRGFYQYQSVIPTASGLDATKEMLKEISQSGTGSFLAVLKSFGERQSGGLLSFPLPGVTLALDFPNMGERTEKLFTRLDSIVRSAGGRVYLAKDARMTKDFFQHSYPRLSEFLKFRDPGIASDMSRRLMEG